MPTALWIWDVSHLELAALLLQKDPIRSVAWDPIHPRIALCTGTSQLYMWTPAGACCVHIPLPQFVVSEIKWNPDGTSLVLKDKEAFCCTFVPVISEFDPDTEGDELK
jgi:WD40 repeat protein